MDLVGFRVKKTGVFLILLSLICSGLIALVYDSEKEMSDELIPGLSVQKEKGMLTKINGSEIKIDKYHSKEKTLELLKKYKKYVMKNKYQCYKNKSLLAAAKMMENAASSKNGSFGYIFFIQKEKKGVFLIFSGDEEGTDIIKTSVPFGISVDGTKGFIDGFENLIEGNKMLSLEIIDSKNVVGFTNTYESSELSDTSGQKIFVAKLQDNGWTIVFVKKIGEGLVIYAEKGGQFRVIGSISDKTGDWITITG